MKLLAQIGTDYHLNHLPHFLNHYLSLGVDRFVCSLQGSRIAEARRIPARSYECASAGSKPAPVKLAYLILAHHQPNHLIDWQGLRPRPRLTLDERDLDDVLRSDALFARKFDEHTSSKLLVLLDEQVHMGAVPAEITHPEQTRGSDRDSTASRWAARLTDPPPVSCICPTYGRVALLEEAIESFLRQDYPGPKELIILNDYEGQTLIFDHPEVRVINVLTRFRTVGEKMNAAVALASHNLLFVWDDDDIYLPHRLTFSLEHFDLQKGFFKPDKAWFWNDGALSGPANNIFHVGSCWSRRLFDAVRGYRAEGTGYDLVFEERLAQQFPGSTNTYDIQPEEIYYLYRWGGTGSYHMSGFGDLKPGENVGHHQAESFVQQRVSRGEIRQGHILLQPAWKTDYRQLVSSAIATLAEQQAREVQSPIMNITAYPLYDHAAPLQPAVEELAWAQANQEDTSP